MHDNSFSEQKCGRDGQKVFLPIHPREFNFMGMKSLGDKYLTMQKQTTTYFKSIHRILNINNYKMESYQIIRKNFLEKIYLTDIDNMIADQQLHWLGKRGRM